jgi:Mg-chelatase subunit ChlD
MTRAYMEASQLVPNHALRNTIEEWVRDHGAAAAAAPASVSGAAASTAFVDAPLRLESARVGPEGSQKLFVRASPIGESTRQPVVLLAILDNSGSMQESAGGAAGSDDFGFTRLDLVKHAVKTIAAILGPQDRLGIVTFTTAARVVLAPTLMDDAGRARVNTALDTVRPDASTNIWDGIRQAAMLASNAAYAGHHIAAVLLTDGVSNINPPRGILPTLRSASFSLINPWTLHAFGFGYGVDSALLADLADWGGGVYGFIPDASMVGTVFINAVAHILTTAVRSAELSATHKLGAVAYGQPREWLLDGGVELPEIAAQVDGSAATVAVCRNEFVEMLAQAIRLVSGARYTEVQVLLDDFYLRMQPYAADHLAVNAMLRDVRSDVEGEGQVGLAVTAPHAQRWGLHYLRAYHRAQQLQMCMNFKDPGLQIYGGDLFHALQDEGDRIFCSLPPPTPSGTARSAAAAYGGAGAASPPAAPMSMSIFHNASAGCFAPGTRIRMADGGVRPIEDLRRGDLVHTPSGNAEVVAMVTCGSYKRYQPMSLLNGLCITPWHPVRVGGAWHFPADLVGYIDRPMPTVYNLVLDRGHVVIADGVEAVTLAHWLVGPVVEHPFFGTDAVLRDLERVNGWDVGLPRFINLVALRNEEGIICGWVDRP